MTYEQFKDSICKSNSEWNTYASDKKTIEYVCAMVNSGIATVNPETNQIRVKNQYRKR